jgi:eukaryotic-like serine/threonine-protein kinase
MATHRPGLISDLFAAALQHPPQARSDFLKGACQGDPDLQHELESLLRYESNAARFFDNPAASMGKTEPASMPPPPDLIGRQLGPYEIVALLGSGGMGDVYRARDSKLGRDVAIKVLPTHFASDPERCGRFTREARLLATLSHPHIGAIYGLQETDGVAALVLELVEGPTLAERLAAGRLPPTQALTIARQIAEALDAAHQRGIVHRDLKPANIVLQGAAGATESDVRVRVLDFGLAKAVAMDLPADAKNDAPVSLGRTAEGRILGTAAYMSPEQARGLTVDKRTDIWAFGCVLFEMLSGKRAFEGNTDADTVARILDEEPDWASIPTDTPATTQMLLDRCLRKEARRRLRDIGDAVLDIEESLASNAGSANALSVSPRGLTWQLRWIETQTSPAQTTSRTAPFAAARRSAWLPWAIVGGFVVSLASTLPLWSRPAVMQPPRLRFDWNLPTHMWQLQQNDTGVISPDGQRFVFGATVDGRQKLVVRDMATTELVVLNGTELAFGPFWSPDSRSIGFFAPDGHVKTIALTGGSPRTIAPAKYEDLVDISGTWRPGVILFGPHEEQMYRVPETGGVATPVEIPAAGDTRKIFTRPKLLPDGRHFLLTAPGETGIYVASLDEPNTRKLMEDGASPRYANGYLFYSRGTTLFARQFDAERLQFSGGEIHITDGAEDVSVSDNGTIVYRPTGPVLSTLTWLDRNGHRTATLGEAGPYDQVVLSPRGRRATLVRLDTRDLWDVNLATGIFSRFTTDPAFDTDPSWAPDERALAFTSFRTGRATVFVKDLDTGKEEQLVKLDEEAAVDQWTPDGRFIVFRTFGKAVYAVPLSGDRKPQMLIDTPFVEDEVHVSPDGRWVSFNSDESGRWEVYVAAFPTFTSKRQVSSGGGVQPQWRADGRELFYIGLDGSMMRLRVTVGTQFTASAPEALFTSRIAPTSGVPRYAVSADGQRFLALEGSDAGSGFTFLINWLNPDPASGRPH